MGINEIVMLILGAMLAENLVLNGALGLDLFAADSKTMKTAPHIGLLFTAVSTTASFAGNLINSYLLAPLGLESLRAIAYVAVVAVLSLAACRFAYAKMPETAKTLGIYLPLTGANSAVLALMLKTSGSGYGIMMSLLVGFGAGIGFLLVSLIFSGVRERIEFADTPKAFAGTPIMFVSAALLCLAFMGLVGLRL
ncbi:MAG: Rnf-Nqr domain containing protein [Oscillospiraceae bacterium]